MEKDRKLKSSFKLDWSTAPNMLGNYGNHAETKGVQELLKNDIETKGVKQVSSHYFCNSCEVVQKKYGIINVTGNAFEHENKQKRNLCVSKE